MDEHCKILMDEFYQKRPIFLKMKDIVLDILANCAKEHGIEVSGIEARVKDENSLKGKLELKGMKYRTLSDITDILGARVITFYNDGVDNIAEIVKNTFTVDWDNSVDKRKMLEHDRFGYMSLHYICQIPKELYYDETCPEINEYWFEIQMRTALQHVWAVINHDTGYKSDVEVPREYMRELSRLAGVLEIADHEFQETRDKIDVYRKHVEKMVKAGNYDKIGIDGDSYKHYLNTNPFGQLAQKMADKNKAELYHVSEWPYLEVLTDIGLRTLGDIEKMKADFSERACQLVERQVEGKELDILSSTIALQNLCIVKIVVGGGGEAGVQKFLDTVYGERKSNKAAAKRLTNYARELGMIG